MLEPVPVVRATCQGVSPKVAAVPPTIFVSFRSVALEDLAQVWQTKKCPFCQSLFHGLDCNKIFRIFYYLHDMPRSK